jgi:ligand-binding SRPBCC domain-containing protein
MATLKNSIVIHAPVEKVFAYMDEPTNLLEIWPSMVDIRNVKEIGGGKKTYDWTYKMAGMKLDGSSEVLEYVLNQRTVVAGRGGIESKFVWTYTPVENGTQVTSQVEYKVPVPVLGKLAESIIVKQNEREAETLLANLKARMETP